MTPHDELVKTLFSRPEVADAQLRAVLPPAFVEALADTLPELVPASFVDDTFPERHADLLFRLRLKDGRAAFAFLLFEHQSTEDVMMPWRLLRYASRIWERWQRENPGETLLPPIVPMVLYHGRAPWSAPRRLTELLRLSAPVLESIRDITPECSFILEDLGHVPDEALQAQALIGLTKLLLKHAREGRLMDQLPGWIETWRAAEAAGGAGAMVALLRYIFCVERRPSERRLRRFLEAAAPERVEEYMSWADHLRAEGRAQGLQQGREQGREQGHTDERRALLLRLIAGRFGAVPAWAAARVQAAEPDQLTAWVDRIFVAESVEALLQ
ncbi:MAG: Rpn family recombination-promoting nuclease/putative transposase [Alphaproteobacteria bacterium]|nr:Rpn family recombination-promoting nuclease/putative transposase [Alphaproteobacteria bacterium]